MHDNTIIILLYYYSLLPIYSDLPVLPTNIYTMKNSYK